ncbi:MAG: polysaccharide deacetylase family protein [Polyangiales bacterium]
MRLAALSVDLDEVPCYAAIHGLPAIEGEAAHAVYRNALPRFEALFDALGLRATFFAIGRDLEDETARAAVGRLHSSGHEIANHSANHRYDLTRCTREEVRAEIEGGMSAIEAATGRPPRGFRAPGYTITDTVLEELESLGAAYDSSVFPCPSYYAAKAVALSSIALRRRRSQSILGDPRVLRAPADPYRVGRPYYRRGSGLLELPIGVTRDVSARLPYIGTTLVLAGDAGAARLTRMIIGRPLVNLELHGIDLADAEPDGLAPLARQQPDLRRALDDKRRALESAIWVLRGAGYQFVTLERAAETFAQEWDGRTADRAPSGD